MSFLNRDYSLEYSVEESEGEAEFLRKKIVELHNKYMEEMEFTKELEMQVQALETENKQVTKDYQNLNRQLERTVGSQQKHASEKVRQAETALVESEKKNDLLRIDLEGMRSKVLEVMAAKEQAEEDRVEVDRDLDRLNQKVGLLTREIRDKDTELAETKQQLERFKHKYERQVTNNQQIEQDLTLAKGDRDKLMREIEQMSVSFRIEKEKHSRSANELIIHQKELKQWKRKAEDAQLEYHKSQEELQIANTKIQNEERNASHEMERLTHEYNNLHALLKQRESELEVLRKKPVEQSRRKQSHYEQTKQMVCQMQKEQQVKASQRSPPKQHKQNLSKSPIKAAAVSPNRVTRSYKQQKESYLAMISNVSEMESQMLACNMERKRIVAQIDRIEETRVKTKDMISRRRKLEMELQGEEKKLERIRADMKKMKVM